MSKSASASNGSCSPDAGSLAHARSRRFRAYLRLNGTIPKLPARVAKTIYDECARLKDFPSLGRASRRMAGRRELTFAPLPYIVVYQVTPNAVEISRIFHAAQDWP